MPLDIRWWNVSFFPTQNQLIELKLGKVIRMKTRLLTIVCCAVGIGYVIGQLSPQVMVPANAVQLEGTGLEVEVELPPVSNDTFLQIQSAFDALTVASEAVKVDGTYVTATKGLNPFLILSAGGDAMADLESGQGVDPYTFSALYAGNANDEVKRDLTFDDNGRLLYKNELVKMYSQEKLEEAFDRMEIIPKKNFGN